MTKPQGETLGDMKPDLFNVAFGAGLTRARESVGVSKTELARRVGLDKSTIGRMETGERGINAAQQEKLRMALGITPLRWHRFMNPKR